MDPFDMPAGEREFIEHLRAEAREVKSCFTTFSFNTLAFSTAILATIIGVMSTIPQVVFACAPAIVILMLVCRIGIFKYSTANRNYGYELNLARLRHLYGPLPSDTFFDLRQIRWEEALRAWRVVQTAIFSEIYTTPEESDVRPRRLRPIMDPFRKHFYQLKQPMSDLVDHFDQLTLPSNEAPYPWFMLKSLTRRTISTSAGDAKEMPAYHGGNYLSNVLGMCYWAQYMLLAPLGFSIIFLFVNWAVGNGEDLILLAIEAPFLVLAVSLVFMRNRRIRRRRTLLEDELLSIHSCAIVWHAVVTAHFLAVLDSGTSMAHYTEHLTEKAADLCCHIGRIHEWIAEKQQSLDLIVRAPTPAPGP